MPAKIAILIDAENISPKDLSEILDEVPRYGDVILKAVYGNWQSSTLQKWHQLALEHDFKIRHQPSSKNSSDIKLMLDAMDVLRWTPVDIFCLVTNDADYIPLCHKLRESRKSIIGVGYPRASDAFIRACDTFIFIGREPMSSVSPSVAKVPSKPTKQPATLKLTDQQSLRSLVVAAFNRVSQDNNGWVTLSALGMVLPKVQTGFKTNTYGHANLSKFLKSMPDFVELRTKKGVVTAARLKDSAPLKPPHLTDLHKLLAQAFAQVPHNTDGWVTLGALGWALPQVQTGFKSNAYGHSNLSKLLKSMPNFVELQTKDGVKFARLKN